MYIINDNILFEKFRLDSDPITDMGIGMGSWLDKVEKFYTEVIFGNSADAELFIEIAYDKLKRLFKKGIDAEEAAESCYDDINLYRKWERAKRGNSNPSDDLKSNCRSYEGTNNEDDAKDLASYLINRYPEYNEQELIQMAYDWVGYEEPINEGCGCGGKKRTLPIRTPRIRPGRPGAPKPNKLYEKFVKDSDPIADMGIGIQAEMEEFFKTFVISHPVDYFRAAIGHKKLHYVKLLAEKYKHDKYTLKKAFTYAVFDNNIPIINLLIPKYVSLNAKIQYPFAKKLNLTPLQYVIYNITDSGFNARSRLRIVRLLLRKGAPIDNLDKEELESLKIYDQPMYDEIMKYKKPVKENKLYNMKNKLYEAFDKYNVDEIAKIAIVNFGKWVSPEDSNYIRNEISDLERMRKYQEAIRIFSEFVDAQITNFFRLFLKFNDIDEQFLEDNKEIIVEKIVKLAQDYRPKDEEIRKYSEQLSSEEEEDDIAKLIRQSKEKKAKTKTYAEMDQYELKQEIDKALDVRDFKKLEEIRPYLKEGFLKYHVEQILNERYEMPKFLETKINNETKITNEAVWVPRIADFINNEKNYSEEMMETSKEYIDTLIDIFNDLGFYNIKAFGEARGSNGSVYVSLIDVKNEIEYKFKIESNGDIYYKPSIDNNYKPDLLHLGNMQNYDQVKDTVDKEIIQ